MQEVKFAKDFDHITPTKTTAYKAGDEMSVPNEVAAAAKAAGKLEEKRGGKPDTGRAAGDAGKSEG